MFTIFKDLKILFFLEKKNHSISNAITSLLLFTAIKCRLIHYVNTTITAKQKFSALFKKCLF